jgi:hypothetical protein
MNTVTFSVLAALRAVLTLASSAGAACAWVLWASVTSGYLGVSGSTEKAQDGFVKIKSLTCLPDTMDPRVRKAR